jgi:hypothetical protein
VLCPISVQGMASSNMLTPGQQLPQWAHSQMRILQEKAGPRLPSSAEVAVAATSQQDNGMRHRWDLRRTSSNTSEAQTTASITVLWCCDRPATGTHQYLCRLQCSAPVGSPCSTGTDQPNEAAGATSCRAKCRLLSRSGSRDIATVSAAIAAAAAAVSTVAACGVTWRRERRGVLDLPVSM